MNKARIEELVDSCYEQYARGGSVTISSPTISSIRSALETAVRETREECAGVAYELFNHAANGDEIGDAIRKLGDE